jgi:signal transduction histidine kinase
VHAGGRRALPAWALAPALALCVVAVLAAPGVAIHPAWVLAARAAIVAVPIAVGLYAWRRGVDARFGRLLIAAGAACLITTFAESRDEVLYSLGRAAGWGVELLLVYLVLAFPSGRLETRTDRALVAAMGAVVAALFVPRLLLAQDFDVPSPYTSCVHDCPGNAFFGLAREPAFVDAIVRPLGVALVFIVMAAVALRLGARFKAATPLTRRILWLVLVLAIARTAFLGGALVARQIDADAPVVAVSAWLLAFAIPAFALVFLLGLLRWRLFAGHALQRLSECVRTVPDTETLRGAFAEAFDDPTVDVVFPLPGFRDGWMDCRGRPVALPPAHGARAVSTVRNDGTVVAALIHDRALESRPELLEAGVALAGVMLDNQRLTAEAQAALTEVRRSRARMAASSARARRRLERDLHDGAQQRLVALRIELGLAEELVRSDPARGADRLVALEHALDDALDELRALAHGVYPPLLADQGLAPALRAATARSPLRVDVEAVGVARYGPEIESAVYFCVLEALQNALKHAGGARSVRVRLDGGTAGVLRFSVRDDGAGSATPHADGAGLTNMRDRLAAAEGELCITTAPDAGTEVSGWVPAPAAAAALDGSEHVVG